MNLHRLAIQVSALLPPRFGFSLSRFALGLHLILHHGDGLLSGHYLFFNEEDLLDWCENQPGEKLDAGVDAMIDNVWKEGLDTK